MQYIEKLDALKKVGDPVVWRFQEDQIRADWVQALSGTVSNYKGAAENPGEKYGHISPDKLTKIVAECNAVSQWLADNQAKQLNIPKHEKPVLICADMEKKNQELAKMADEILKEPKPAPPKEEKKEEKKEEGKAEDASAGAAPEGTPPAEGPKNMDVD